MWRLRNFSKIAKVNKRINTATNNDVLYIIGSGIFNSLEAIVYIIPS